MSARVHDCISELGSKCARTLTDVSATEISEEAGSTDVTVRASCVIPAVNAHTCRRVAHVSTTVAGARQTRAIVVLQILHVILLINRFLNHTHYM